MQDEKMFGTFTVEEHLNFVANLRLPSGMSTAEKKARV
jgi:ABC-type multidrug transport system ATPase subunit